MIKNLINYISEIIHDKIISHTTLSGGDISNAYLLRGKIGDYFIKTNQSSHAHDMFTKEGLGLKAISSTGSIRAPKVIAVNQYLSYAFIIMEYVEPKNLEINDYANLGFQLADMHLNHMSEFGWTSNNHIGVLPQSNRECASWPEFYATERLTPQIKLAVTKGFLEYDEVPIFERMTGVIHDIMPLVKPCLLHGDLWSGNYLISKNGIPYMIDPAVYYGHHEVDIAMTKLFGGFGSCFYEAYHEKIPVIAGEEVRIQLYQLYYLLVHLNHFGRSYYAPVKKILSRYFG